MLKEILPIIAIVAPIIIVALNYWKEIRTKKESELYIRKAQFYEEIIDYLNAALKQEDNTRGTRLIQLYNKAYIFSNDEVILELNKFLDVISGKTSVPVIDLKPVIAKILIACRKDLGIKTTINVDLHYKAPFS